MLEPTPDFLSLLAVLQDHGVEFIVVGGVCAVLQGVPVTTMDLDIVHRRTEDNIERLLAALEELDACSRLDKRRLRPQASHLRGPGHQLLTTRAGLLDVLGAVADGRDYDALLTGTEELLVDQKAVRLLSLETLLEVKERTGRPKDLAVLPLIRHTLDERKRG